MTLPLISSDKALAAFLRLGCYVPRNAKGSHLVVCRDTPAGRRSRPLVMGLREVKRATLASTVHALGFTDEEFIAALR